MGLKIPRPADAEGLVLGAALDFARGRDRLASWSDPGVAGESVPIRDLRIAERGVMLPLRDDVGGVSSLTGDRVRAKGSRRWTAAGELGAEPARRGVSGLFVFRKLELRAGVNGFALCCLSTGILEIAVSLSRSR